MIALHILLLLGCYCQVNDAHPFFTSKASIQTPQSVNVSTQKTHPMLDKIRQLKAAVMALFQKKMDELRIIAGGLPSIGAAMTQQASPQPSPAAAGGTPASASTTAG
uniref:Uncharacterized protein n=1 Tax=Graphocephala atropunctata TaxID=36148 RepID=A0A1B6LAS7_9HEMI